MPTKIALSPDFEDKLQDLDPSERKIVEKKLEQIRRGAPMKGLSHDLAGLFSARGGKKRLIAEPDGDGGYIFLDLDPRDKVYNHH